MSTINYLDVDECSNETFPCGDNAHCTDSDGSFECNCLTGFQGDGFNCTGMYFTYLYRSIRRILYFCTCTQILMNVKNLLVYVQRMLLVQTV